MNPELRKAKLLLMVTQQARAEPSEPRALLLLLQTSPQGANLTAVMSVYLLFLSLDC